MRKAPEGDLIGTSYQLAKYIKHTVPDPRYPVQSVFSSTSTQVYGSYLVESMAAGSLEVDDHGRSNVIWTAGKETGFLFQSGRLVQPQDAVKVVLTTSTGQIHAYPANSTTFYGVPCVQCGRPVIS